MRLYDISLTVTPGLPVWPGDPKFSIERMSDMRTGAAATVSRVAMGVHTGTHIDAPAHFIRDGAGIDALPLDALVGPARVVLLRPRGDAIGAGELVDAKIPRGTRRLLLRTPNSARWRERRPRFHRDFLALAPEAAAWIVARGIRLVGIDALSIAPFRNGAETHRILLSAGVVVVEGLDLGAVPAGRYTLAALPVKLGGADGAPARAVLMGR